jgi:hypothetical protein
VVKSFVLGTIVGGATVWFYGDRIREYIDARTEAWRQRVAGGIEAVTDSLQSVKERVEDGLSGQSVLPNPPAPRAVGGSDFTSSSSTR